MLDLEMRAGSPAPGAPIIDGTGNVAGVFVRVCRLNGAAPAAPGASAGGAPDTSSAPAGIAGVACAPAFYGAPVSAIRGFLVRTPLNAVAPSPWLGIVGAPDVQGSTRGVRVMAVAPQSPAAKAGLKTNAERTLAHLIVAVDGHPVDTPEKLAELIGKHGIGETVKVMVLESDKLHEVPVVLRAAP